MLVGATAAVDEKDYWICACVRRNRRREMTHIKANHRAVERCGRCGVTREQSDRLDAALNAGDLPADLPAVPNGETLSTAVIGCNS